MRRDYSPAPLVRVHLKGSLGEKFGEAPFEFHAETAREVIDALCATVDGFREEIKRLTVDGANYQILSPKFPEGMDEGDLGKFCGEEIYICPILEGQGAFGRIVAGAALIAVGAFTGFAPAMMVGASLALGGVSQLLTPRTPAPNDPEREKKEIKSSSFSSATGIADRDYPIPLLYGFHRCPNPPVLSSGITTVQLEPED